MLRMIGLVMLLLSASTGWAAGKMPSPEVVKVNERVYALIGPLGLPSPANHGYAVNSTLIIGDKGAILVDSGSSDEAGKTILAAVRKLTDKPVTHVINTHHHGDHVLGNSVFPKAQIIGSEACKKLVDETGHEWVQIMRSMAKRPFPGTRPVAPGVTVPASARQEQLINGVKLVLWVPEPSHTPGDMMVYLPDDKVMIGGDILVNHVSPQFRDAVVKNWVNTLNTVQDFGAQTYIPGHGPLMKPSEVAHLAGMMGKLYSEIEAGYKAGLTDSEIRQKLDLSEWKKLVNFEEHMGGNVNRAYLEIEAANF